MSVRVSAKVWGLTSLAPSEKLVLLYLADKADDEGNNVFPSIPRIARECCLSESTVHRVIASMKAAGSLIPVQERPGKTVVYRIDLSRLEQPLNDVNPCHHDTPVTMTPLSPRHPTPVTMTPNPLINHQSIRELPISPQLTTSGRERGVGERDLKGSEPTSVRLSGNDAIASSPGVLPSEFDGMFRISVLADEAGEPDGPEERARALMVRSRIERNDQNHALGEPPPNESQADRIRRQAQEMRAARGA